MTHLEAMRVLNGRQSRHIAHATILRKVDDDTVAVAYHATDVVLIHRDGTYTLDSGGYHKMTTKKRIRQYSPARLYQKGGVWYVDDTTDGIDSIPIEFFDGMKVDDMGFAIDSRTAKEKEHDGSRTD